MAFQLCIAISLGSAKAGLTLKAQLVDSAGSNVGSAVTTGFSERAGGMYLWNYASFPDAFRGIVEFRDNGSSELYAIEQVNPEELNVAGSGALTAAERNAIADAILNRNVAGGSSAGRLVKEALYALRNKRAEAGGTMTVYGVDDSTPSWTAAVGREPKNPATSVDPA